MLNASTVCGILHHLLLAKTSTVIICKAVDIDNFVSRLLQNNPDLVYVKHDRMIKNRVNNARIRFFTKVGIGASFKGLNPENAFIVGDADEKIVAQAQSEFKNVFYFSPIVES